ARLRALLRDARHRAVYIDLMRMHAMLQWRFGQPSAEPRRSETESLLLEVLEQEQSARDRQAARDAAACNAVEPRDERLVLACPPAHQPLTPVRHIVIPRWMIYGGIAALLIVSALLFLPHGQTPIH